MRLDVEPHTEEQRPIKQSFCRSLRRDTHWKCLILTLLILGCLGAITWCRLTVVKRIVVNFYHMPITRTNHTSPCDDGYIYIPIAFVVMLYLVYLVECWHSHTRIELQGKMDVNTVYEKIQAMREALPIVWWKAVCYHYVRRTRQVTRYRNGDAFTTTQVYYERVNSHSASSAFNFSTCGVKDISKTLINLDNYPATKIKFTKGFSFATVEAENEFEDQRGAFFQDHERRDDYMETREGLDLLNVNFKDYMITFADPENLPWYVSHIVFWLSSLFLLSWPLRVLIEYKTAYVHYHVHKLFGWNYLDPSWCPGTMSRVSTMGSSELELNIRNNYTMVPSYSEALLMDFCPPHSQDANGNITPNNINGFIPHSYSSYSYRSLYQGAMHSPTGEPIIYVNGQVANGFVQNAHVVTGNGHVGNGTANGHIRNGFISNGYLPNSNAFVIENRHVQTGSLQNIAVHRSRSEELDDRSQQRRRKKRRKRQRQREAETPIVVESQQQQMETIQQTQSSDIVQTDGAQNPSENEGVLSRQDSRQSDSLSSLVQSPTQVSTPDSVDNHIDTAAQSSDSLTERSLQASVASTSQDTIHRGPSSSGEASDGCSLQSPSTVQIPPDVPPPYDEAVNMRIPPGVHLDYSYVDQEDVHGRRSGRPYHLRCMETSL